MIGEKELLRHSRISMDSIQGLHFPNCSYKKLEDSHLVGLDFHIDMEIYTM